MPLTIEQQATVNRNTFNSDFNTASDLTVTLIDSYEGLLNNVLHVKEYYDTLLEQNTAMKKELKNKFSDVVTNDRKTFYEDQKIESLYFYYKIILFMYFVACVSLAVSIITNPSDTLRKKKIVMLVVFVIYPFICTRLFLFLGTLYDNVVSLLPKNVYKNPEINYTPNQE
jgi:lipopolysaccharide export LptBFGC system permease protein LptF